MTFALALAVAGVGVAAAGVSEGDYSYHRQGCTGHADDSNSPDRVEQGCQNATANLSDGNGHELFRAGTQQTADHERVHEATTHTDPQGFDPSTGATLYFGADDNLDSGEHDSSSKIGDGPSDGGGIHVTVDPASVATWVDAVSHADVAYLLTHPAPLVHAGVGACADGACFSVQSQRQVAYQGGNKRKHRDAANYAGKQWDPETCGGPSDTAADCGPGGISHWHRKEGTVYVEPGAQVYEDPNPEGSPIGPYPLPAAYAGTCGVVAGGGTAPAAPASPLTNSAGQVVVSTGC